MTEALLFSIIVGLFFLCLGSFATMLIHRLHFDEPIWKDQRSHCPHCKKKLSWKELFPLFSWLFQRGKCKKCGKKISPIYPLMEASFALLGGIFAFVFFGQPIVWPVLGVLFGALCLFWYDVRFMEVDRRISWPVILFVLLWIFCGQYIGWERALSWKAYMLGGGLGMGFYAIQYFLSRGRWVGFGDLELGLFMGMVLGWKAMLLGMFLAYIGGTLIATPLLIWGHAGRKTALPMGAFLIPAMLVMMLWGSEIEAWYWSLVLPY